ncbi:MAG: ParB family transcriptional regulator, chromosome partitioning protein [Chloroflexota bacterium]|nr:ParB family transcriptional regulator, chromosome partitioning protein [Chloroflexota bacterium]
MLARTTYPHGWFDTETRLDEPERLRAELTAIDGTIVAIEPSTLRRAELLAARKRVYETLHPGSRHGGAPGRAGGGKARRSEEGQPPIRSHAADAAIRTGLSERTVRQLVQIAEDIPAPLRDLIRDTPLALRQRQLLEIARAYRDPEEQRRRAGAALTATLPAQA